MDHQFPFTNFSYFFSVFTSIPHNTKTIILFDSIEAGNTQNYQKD